MTRSSDSQQKKITWHFIDFAVLADYRVKLKEWENIDKSLRPCLRTKKKLWNMKVTVISIVIGALWTNPKWLVKGLENLETWG